MKAPTSRRPNGFTLVELLVVVMIIAVLATLGIGTGLRQLEKAKRTTTMAAARGIESAVNLFFTEYGSMPSDDSEDTTYTTEAGGDGVDLLTVLMGLEPPGTPKNTRGIKFLQVTEGKNNTNGIIYNGSAVDGLYDPWGGSYKIRLDLDLDEKITPVTTTVNDDDTKILNGRRVAVWSNGADGVNGGGKKEDDVKTW